MEDVSRTIQVRWPTVVVRIQYFSFGSRREATGLSIAGRRRGDNELILAPWEGSVTQCDGVTMSIGGEAVPMRGKERDDAGWVHMDFTGLKNKENARDRFNCYKWMLKI
jgi:hypothetical protein